MTNRNTDGYPGSATCNTPITTDLRHEVRRLYKVTAHTEGHAERWKLGGNRVVEELVLIVQRLVIRRGRKDFFRDVLAGRLRQVVVAIGLGLVLTAPNMMMSGVVGLRSCWGRRVLIVVCFQTLITCIQIPKLRARATLAFRPARVLVRVNVDPHGRRRPGTLGSARRGRSHSLLARLVEDVCLGRVIEARPAFRSANRTDEGPVLAICGVARIAKRHPKKLLPISAPSDRRAGDDTPLARVHRRGAVFELALALRLAHGALDGGLAGLDWLLS